MKLPLNPAQIIKTALGECFLETDGIGHWTVGGIYLTGALDYLHLSERERDKKEKSRQITLLTRQERARRIAVRRFWESKEDAEDVPPPRRKLRKQKQEFEKAVQFKCKFRMC